MATTTFDITTIDPSGRKLVSGIGVLEGSNPSTVRLGLSRVDSFVATLLGSSAPGLGTSTLSHTVNADGTVSVYGWMPTSNADPTLIASTGTERFSFVAMGR